MATHLSVSLLKAVSFTGLAFSGATSVLVLMTRPHGLGWRSINLIGLLKVMREAVISGAERFVYQRC